MVDILTVTIPALDGVASLRIPMSWSNYEVLGEVPNVEYGDGLCIVNPPTPQHARIVQSLVDLFRPTCPATHEVLVPAAIPGHRGGLTVDPRR